ncbi:hypothetical protein QYF61_019666 [Mycteria americana]|uniref:Uncharacterized protein n=1 Tax=Mycteria americana TaxID=33587 RepID=A0AAN7NGZ7_MYCAM|nr:hypothetical protein QYF61_019666 [Mycteria americana]
MQKEKVQVNQEDASSKYKFMLKPIRLRQSHGVILKVRTQNSLALKMHASATVVEEREGDSSSKRCSSDRLGSIRPTLTYASCLAIAHCNTQETYGWEEAAGTQACQKCFLSFLGPVREQLQQDTEAKWRGVKIRTAAYRTAKELIPEWEEGRRGCRGKQTHWSVLGEARAVLHPTQVPTAPLHPTQVPTTLLHPTQVPTALLHPTQVPTTLVAQQGQSPAAFWVVLLTPGGFIMPQPRRKCLRFVKKTLGNLTSLSSLFQDSGFSSLQENQPQAKQPQLPQPLLIRLVLQTLHQLRCPSLDTLQHLNVSLVVRGPKLNTVFEVRPHQCRVQGHDHFPSPAGHAIPDTSQDAVGFLGHLGTLLAHIQSGIDQHPQVLFHWAAFQPLFPKPVALHGVVVTQVQDPALGLVKPHTIDLGPSIQPVQVPLQSLPTLKQINTPAQLGVICKLTEGALDPLIQIIDIDIKQDWPQN